MKHTRKTRDLIIITAIYLLAFAGGWGVSLLVTKKFWRLFIFDIAATVITFAFSVLLHNSSVYDAYWSLTPQVMSIWLFAISGAFGLWHIMFLVVFNVWSTRLTINWCKVFTDFSYEDWRYRKFREENSPFMWFLANFFGIHMVPTLVVFAGMLPLFAIVEVELNALSIPGMIIILYGVALEFFADRQMHSFLEKTKDSKEKVTCREGLWRFSRHPNYLGEITVWIGVYITMLPFAPEKWYYGIGALLVVLLFNFISIPLMEKRQMSRRSDYAEYKKNTSRLLLRI